MSGLFCEAQTVVKYYDATWAPAPQDKAVYYANFTKATFIQPIPTGLQEIFYVESQRMLIQYSKIL